MNKFRRRIIEKLAQAATPDNLPTAEVTSTTTVSGSPPSFVATEYYPEIIQAFNSRNATIINGLTNVLNQALYYSSNGQVHLQWMRQVNFNFGMDGIPSVDLKNLMGFAKQLYMLVFTNHGEPDKQPLNPQEIEKRINLLKTSQFVGNLSSTNPVGQLSSKIGGNIKTIINDYLLQIK